MTEILIPTMKLTSEANSKENRFVANARHKKQKKAVRIFLNSFAPVPVSVPCKVTLIRGSPRAYDQDNNISAFKYIRDEISDFILGNRISKTGKRLHGRNDGDDRITWEYCQEKTLDKEYYIKIQIHQIDS